ncbi:ATP-binding protein [Streptomyces sp. OF3]|uniref:ATP-binding protein n=1 Tax=Streptomyces alkaliterrae TaxID=2213162 RepID=A0A7W3WLS3_9ACTN|nr:ATP-binding protein [Streptomyces alkaliterrae]MBB1254639.1 ATP-binding protein [Streptomyces alkaliterrae]
MNFTALHRALGVGPGPLTDELLDSAVAAGVRETGDLDWKASLPPSKGLPQTDFPKDVAAMANSGGGLIVFGVREEQKAATERVDVGEIDESRERSLCAVAISAISPPVFGVKVHCLGQADKRAVVVEVPASTDTPHLIYRNEYFGAPVRNDSDTVWMKERQIEALYRARFEQRRHTAEALDALFADASAGRDSHTRAWLIGVAHPRIPRFRERLSAEDAEGVFSESKRLAGGYAPGGIHPLGSVDRLNPRPGLRRWVAVNTALHERSKWKESWASIHHDGAVTLAAAVGGHPRSSEEYDEGYRIASIAIECAVADLMALVRATAAATDNDEYDVRVGIDWHGEQPLTIFTRDNFGLGYGNVPIPLYRYAPVETTVDASASDSDFHQHVHDLAQDCVNQGGVSNVLLIQPPARDEQE